MMGFDVVLRKTNGLPTAPFFSTHASAIAEIKCRLFFGDEAAGVDDVPRRGWSEGGISKETGGGNEREATSFFFFF